MKRLTRRQLRWRIVSAFYGHRATRGIVSTARMSLYGALDLGGWALREDRPWYAPPRRLSFTGEGSDPLIGGRRLVELLREYGSLTSASGVLDIGCGAGRVAVALLDELSPDAHYRGFDVVPDGVEWCSNVITPRRPSFRFQVANVKNERYNPDVSLSAAEYRFPYEDESFDLAFGTSVFTHLMPADAENYVRQAFRVLRPGGRLLGTWFLLGGARERAEGAQGDEEAWFPHELDGCRVVSRRVPEFAIGYPKARVVGMHRDAGFDIEHVAPGSWLGTVGPTWQDLFVAVKPTLRR